MTMKLGVREFGTLLATPWCGDKRVMDCIALFFVAGKTVRINYLRK